MDQFSVADELAVHGQAHRLVGVDRHVDDVAGFELKQFFQRHFQLGNFHRDVQRKLFEGNRFWLINIFRVFFHGFLVGERIFEQMQFVLFDLGLEERQGPQHQRSVVCVSSFERSDVSLLERLPFFFGQ